jgi:hypothetical protein
LTAPEERRRAQRHPIALRIDFEAGMGTTRDVSGLGVLFHTTEQFAPGDFVEFYITFPDAGRARCKGYVVRVSEDQDSEGFLVAATIDRCLLVARTPGDESGNSTAHLIVKELEVHHPEGWEWGE